MLSITGICSAGSGLQKAVADWAHVAQFLFVARAKSPGEFVVAKESLLNELLGPVVESMGYTFWGLEYISQGKDTVLRVFIDHENGITVDDCAAVSRQISSVMDVEDPISQVYNLEVSSPGMDRPVFTLEQYASLAGNIIDVRLRMAFDGRRKFKGQLIGVEQEDIVLRVDDNEYLLPIERKRFPTRKAFPGKLFFRRSNRRWPQQRKNVTKMKRPLSVWISTVKLATTKLSVAGWL